MAEDGVSVSEISGGKTGLKKKDGRKYVWFVLETGRVLRNPG